MELIDKVSGEIVTLQEVGTIGDRPYAQIYFNDGRKEIISFDKLTNLYEVK